MPGAESRDGASFNKLFGTALSLGILSRRRVYFEAIKHEKEQNCGFLSPFGSGATISAAVDSVSSMEVLYQLCTNYTFVLTEVVLLRFTL